MAAITKKILVTGGVGFVWYNVARMLSEEAGNHIYILDCLSGAGMDEEFKALAGKDNVTLYDLDPTDPASYDKVEQKYHQVYHLAAVGARNATDRPDLQIRANTLSTINLLEFIKRAGNRPRLLFASSSESYASSIRHCNVTTPVPEDIPLCIDNITDPTQACAAASILGEIACYQYAKLYGFGCIIVRYHDLYGPRMSPQHIIPGLFGRLMECPERLELSGGHQCRSFCYVTDAARMTIRLMGKEKSIGKAINVGSGREAVPLVDIGRMLAAIAGIRPEIVQQRSPVRWPAPPVPDLTAIQALDAYVSEVPIHAGLLNTCRWFGRNFAFKGPGAPAQPEAPAPIVSAN
jgi:nucleoside-diphosphate-sugar epimerase